MIKIKILIIFIFFSCKSYNHRANKIYKNYDNCLVSKKIKKEYLIQGLAKVYNDFNIELKNKDTIYLIFESGIFNKTITVFHKNKSCLYTLKNNKNTQKVFFEKKGIDSIKHEYNTYKEIFNNYKIKSNCIDTREGKFNIYYFKIWSHDINDIELRKYSCDSLLRTPIYPKNCKK